MSLTIFSLKTQQIEVILVATKSAFIVLSLYPLSFFANTSFKDTVHYIQFKSSFISRKTKNRQTWTKIGLNKQNLQEN